MAATQLEPHEILRRQFVKLNDLVTDESYEEAIESCDSILKEYPEDDDALNTKIACLVEINQFDAALALFKKECFEKAYCLYRKGKLNDALTTIEKVKDDPQTLLQLKAQVLYRLERYDDCIKIYEQLRNESEPDHDLDANLMAAYVARTSERIEQSYEIPDTWDQHGISVDSSWELLYNAACGHIAVKNYGDALELLDQAEQKCLQEYQQNDEQGLSEEVLDELAPVRTQRAFALQQIGKDSEALSAYTEILKSKPTDRSTLAVASNNSVVLQGNHDLFAAAKKLRVASGGEVMEKLSRAQKRAIGFNRAVLALTMNKMDQCGEMLTSLEKDFPQSGMRGFISASFAFQQKDNDACESELTRVAKEHPADATRALLYLAHVQLAHNEPLKAVSTLEKIENIFHMPAIVATRAALLTQCGKIEAADSALSGSVGYWEDLSKHGEGTQAENNLKLLLKQSALYLHHKGSFNESALMYEKLFNLDRGNMQNLVSLISVLSFCDVEKAERYTSYLQGASEDFDDIDVDALEKADKFVVTTSKQSQNATDNKSHKGEKKSVLGEAPKPEDKTKPKKKKKIILPKNYDPNATIDNERWLPLPERSYFKKSLTGKRKYVGKGASQGMTPTVEKSNPQKGKEETQPPVATSSRKKNPHKKKGGRKGRRK